MTSTLIDVRPCPCDGMVGSQRHCADCGHSEVAHTNELGAAHCGGYAYALTDAGQRMVAIKRRRRLR